MGRWHIKFDGTMICIETGYWEDWKGLRFMWKFWNKKGDEEENGDGIGQFDETSNEEQTIDGDEAASDETIKEAVDGITGAVIAGTVDEASNKTMGEAADEVSDEIHKEAHEEAHEEANNEADDEAMDKEELADGRQKAKKGSFWKWLGFRKNTDDEESDEEEKAEAGMNAEAHAGESLEEDGLKTDSLDEDRSYAEGLEGLGSGTGGSDGQGSDAEGSDGERSDASDQAESAPKKEGLFARLKAGLAKTRDNIVKGIDRLFSGSALDDDFYEELEEILIMGDIGVNATTAIIERLKAQVKEQHIKEPKDCKELLIQSIRDQMEVGETAYDFETKQSIIMVIGVNGVGKTTTVGKLAWKLKDEGKKVLIAAADTFRAAAGDQLAEWASRAGVPMIGGKEGADPASVVFDAVNAAKARGVDILLIDTAGRLHNKKNLMEELRKMNRIIDREYPNAHRENLIVLDGTTGQNALVQAREFGDVTNLTGIVLTKMDGTAKGGIAVAIQSELQIPVKYIGVGETTQDLQKFDPDEFVRALFDVDLSEESAEETEEGQEG